MEQIFQALNATISNSTLKDFKHFLKSHPNIKMDSL